MKKLIIVFLLFISGTLFAQIKITGKVSSPENTPIDLAEVILTDKDSIALKNDFTNEKGEFQLEAKSGWYKLQIRQSNKIVFSTSFDLIANYDLGVITIQNVNQLEAVTVVGKKKLIEKKIDRLVFNIENTISASGGDGLDALKITPGVKVQNDIVSIIGKGTVRVMVDDKLVQLKDDDLGNYLKSISSDNIKSIEVITTPPAKYDAVGNSGIINIITKKAKKDTWSAALGTSYAQRSRPEGAVFGNFNKNKNGLTISTSFNYKDGSKYHEQDDNAFFPDALWYTSSPFLQVYKRLSASLGIDYQVNKNWKTGIQYSVNSNLSKWKDLPYTPIIDYTTNEITQYLKSNGNQKHTPNIHSVNYFNEFKLDSLDRKLTLNFDYFNFDNNDDASYNGVSVINNPFSQQYYAGINSNYQNIQNFSGKVDLEFPMKWIDLSFGGKIANSKSKNTITSFNSGLVDAAVVSQPLTSNLFEYDENIQALYFSSTKQINDKWETQLGVRMEATQTTSNSITLNQITKNNYVKFFPTVYLSYKLQENGSFNFNYSKRIDRASFNELNPNQLFLNPFQKVEGNPFLQPSFVDVFQLNYTYNNLVSELYYSYEDNLFGQISIANSITNEINFTNKNYVNTKRFGFSENYTFDALDWFTSNTAIDVAYVKSASFITALPLNQEGWSARFSTNNDFILNANKTKLFNINYYYSPKAIDGKYYVVGAISNLSLTFQYLALDKNLKFSIRANDVLRTEKVVTSSTVNDVLQKGIYYHDNQSVQLTVSYKFGNQKIRAERRETGNEDERNRTGN